MEINIFDIVKQNLVQQGIDINQCVISHYAVLAENATTDPVELTAIDASNEYFYLLTNLKNGSIILSDVDSLVVDNALKETIVGKSLLVFSGIINITTPASIDQYIEFLRVTPLTTNINTNQNTH